MAGSEALHRQQQTDEDMSKGAVEDDALPAASQVSLNGQLGHRDQDERLKDNDSDFPEPDAMEEHSGEDTK